VNTVAKALDAKENFDGIEIDVVYDPQIASFSVFHPPKPDVGLRIEHLLAAVADRPTLKLWLDFKNADDVDVRSVLERLDALHTRWGLKQRVIVELPESVNAGEWKRLAAAGWAVSLYLPYSLADCGTPNARHFDKCRFLVDGLLTKANLIGAKYLSFDISVLPAVLLHMGVERRGSLKLLTWQLRINSAEPGLVETIRPALIADGVIIGANSKFSR
jgi:hypothetical protein